MATKNTFSAHAYKTIRERSRRDKADICARTTASAGWVRQGRFEQGAVLAIEIAISLRRYICQKGSESIERVSAAVSYRFGDNYG